MQITAHANEFYFYIFANLTEFLYQLFEALKKRMTFAMTRLHYLLSMSLEINELTLLPNDCLIHLINR